MNILYYPHGREMRTHSLTINNCMLKPLLLLLCSVAALCTAAHICYRAEQQACLVEEPCWLWSKWPGKRSYANVSPLFQQVRGVWHGVVYSRPWLRHGPEKGQLSQFMASCSEHQFRICVCCHVMPSLHMLLLERALLFLLRSLSAVITCSCDAKISDM